MFSVIMGPILEWFKRTQPKIPEKQEIANKLPNVEVVQR